MQTTADEPAEGSVGQRMTSERWEKRDKDVARVSYDLLLLLDAAGGSINAVTPNS